jgi:hypothetical protein
MLAGDVALDVDAGRSGHRRLRIGLPRNSPVMSDVREEGERPVGRGSHLGRATVDGW